MPSALVVVPLAAEPELVAAEDVAPDVAVALVVVARGVLAGALPVPRGVVVAGVSRGSAEVVVAVDVATSALTGVAHLKTVGCAR